MDLSANNNNNDVIVHATKNNNCFSFDGGSDLDDDDNKMLDFDHKRLLLRKNLSWTHSSSNSHQSTNNNNNNINSNAKMCSNLKTSRSNPLVLDAVVAATTKTGTFTSKLKLATSQLFPRSFPAPLQSQSNEHCNKVAPLAISTTSTFTAATTHQIVATPTAIQSSGIGKPSVYHALVVIFLEYFSWGLLTMPVINVLNQTFPEHTFLMNGLVMGIKGILSFLSAPLIGALSDVWGRKFFLLITVFFTCIPIPLMSINSWWFFAMISISGVFSVTFSVVFAYVADVTTVEERSRAYGLVSATFAASLVISPALGAYLNDTYSEPLIVALATAVAILDVFFILVAVPESLPEKVRPRSSWGESIKWEQADPFAALRRVGADNTVLMQCVTVLLSYLPEAGQYSCIFVYLKLKMHFSGVDVSIFIAVVGILSIVAQVTLGDLMRVLGAKKTIIIGLTFEMMQLLWFGVGSQTWMMWTAGILAALGSITYPAISAFVSIKSTPDQQGVVQGMVTGMRGLCNGLGPAMFGIIFYLFNVDLNDESKKNLSNQNFDTKMAFSNQSAADSIHQHLYNSDLMANNHGNNFLTQYMPGPPFVFGSLMVICAILVALFIKEDPVDNRKPSLVGEMKRPLDNTYDIEEDGARRKTSSPLSPLVVHEDSAQL
ncbi:unnamed protein product [Diamesa tonsa]